MAGKPGALSLHPEGVSAAAKELGDILRRDLGYAPRDSILENAVKRVVRVYLPVSRTVSKKAHDRLHPGTRALMEMEVGDNRLFPATALQVFRCRMRTARRFMENPDARWSAKAINTREVRVRRLPDGATPEADPWDTPRVVFLAKLVVGKPTLAPLYKNRQSMSHGTKMSARKLLGNPDAEWTAKTTPKGVVVTRVK